MTQRAKPAIGLMVHYAIDTGRSKMTLECLNCGVSRLVRLAYAIAELVKEQFAIAGVRCVGLVLIAGPQAYTNASQALPVK